MTSKRISKILELKQFTTDMYEAELKKSMNSLRNEEAKLSFIEKDIQTTIDEYSQTEEDGLVNLQKFELYYNYLQHMNKKAQKQKEIISRKTLDVQNKKNKVIDVLKEKKMVEILLNKLLDEEIKESDKKEQKELDFNYLSRKTRK